MSGKACNKSCSGRSVFRLTACYISKILIGNLHSITYDPRYVHLYKFKLMLNEAVSNCICRDDLLHDSLPRPILRMIRESLARVRFNLHRFKCPEFWSIINKLETDSLKALICISCFCCSLYFINLLLSAGFIISFGWEHVLQWQFFFSRMKDTIKLFWSLLHLVPKPCYLVDLNKQAFGVMLPMRTKQCKQVATVKGPPSRAS